MGIGQMTYIPSTPILVLLMISKRYPQRCTRVEW